MLIYVAISLHRNKVLSNASDLRGWDNRLVGADAKHPFRPDTNVFHMPRRIHGQIVQVTEHFAVTIHD